LASVKQVDCIFLKRSVLDTSVDLKDIAFRMNEILL